MAEQRNADLSWDEFDSYRYFDVNYRQMHEVDAQIIDHLRDFFDGTGLRDASGIDVGCGPNLYPSMAMLPFCSSIELWEYSKSNVAWLEKQLADYSTEWDPYWERLAQSPPWRAVDNPRQALQRCARPVLADLFALPERHWDIGTMFFVACSISGQLGEFDQAVRCFLRCLRPDAPFAAAFMIESEGYEVADVAFPAVSVRVDDVRSAMAAAAYNLEIHSITTASPHRDGFDGMVLVVGRAAS